LHLSSAESVCRIQWPPVSVRSNLLCNYIARLATQPAHLPYRVVIRPSLRYRYEFLTLAPLPVGVRLHYLQQWLGIQLPHSNPLRIPPVPPWDIPHRTCDLRLTRYFRGVKSALMYRIARNYSCTARTVLLCVLWVISPRIGKECFCIQRPCIRLPPPRFRQCFHRRNVCFVQDSSPLTRMSTYCLYRLCKSFAVSLLLLARPSYCYWDPTPAHLGTTCGVLLGTWTLCPTWQRGRRCGSQSCSYARTARYRSSCRHWRLHLLTSRSFILVTRRVWQCSW
jgi:hypothetical protein